jgi:hypothetical protein
VQHKKSTVLIDCNASWKTSCAKVASLEQIARQSVRRGNDFPGDARLGRQISALTVRDLAARRISPHRCN